MSCIGVNGLCIGLVGLCMKALTERIILSFGQFYFGYIFLPCYPFIC